MKIHSVSAAIACLAVFLFSCKEKSNAPSAELISDIHLKRGRPISCGPVGNEFGKVDFGISCGKEVKNDFNLGLEMLHSFEYDEAEKVFAGIIDKEPGCAMAYWGVAMSNFHPLWTPPTEEELKKGSKAVALARFIEGKSKKESGYIDAVGAFYDDWNAKDHRTRCLNFEKAMEKLHNDFPNDKEAAIFYALALDAAASPTDKTYAKQKKAAEILNALYPTEPNHPGVIHYIIHTYDYPGLAILGLPAARRYASVAPSSAHALHMPSHIFTRLGYWDECIQSNIASVAAARCYAESSGLPGHYDEEFHGLDYLVYAYLQKGENDSAIAQLNYLRSVSSDDPMNFKVAYAYAAIPCRIVLENRNWKAAAELQAFSNVPWKKYPWEEGIIHFTRALGAIHTGNFASARTEVSKLQELYGALVALKDGYKARQLDVQVKASEAWILFKEGKKMEAITLMRKAADIEDSAGKHPVTPGEVVPARELLGDMYMEAGQPVQALQEYEEALKKSPNRFNLLSGAMLAANKTGNKEKANAYYAQLRLQTTRANRPVPAPN